MILLRSKILRASLIAAALPLLLLVITALTSEKMVVDKLLTLLVMPTAMVWLLLWALVWFTWVFNQRRLALCVLLVWCSFTVITSPLTAYFFSKALEQNVDDFDVETLPEFAAIIVLGGGSSESPSGRAVVSGAGERLVLGARLFHAGKTQTLITTGEIIESLRRRGEHVDRNSAEQTKELWMSLSIPEANILMLGGRNTKEEMVELARWRKGLPETAKVGLITSAWHMPRAQRLAERAGLELFPLPADFIAGRPPAHLIELLPSSGAASKLELVLKEYLAMLVGR
jgi:uncharacterized SAM-binding protein YcdF (DUF218 family)